MRADGSSKFGANNKYGYFPSFAAAWHISQEPFFKWDFINSLKIRGGWGKTGNQEFPAGSSQARYALLNGGGIAQVNNPNPDLKWQSDKQVNIGVDVAVFDNRLSTTMDYFHKTTTDLLYPSAPIQPAPPGSVVRWVNLDGNIINKGVEIAVKAAISQKQNFSWDMSVYATFLKNTVSGAPSAILTGSLEGPGVSGALIQTIQNGLPVNAFYTRKFTGLEKSTGQALYEDNGNTFYYAGNPNPKALLGFSTILRYKNLSLEANMNGAFGQSIFNNMMLNLLNVGGINTGRNIALSVYQNPVKESLSNPVTPSSRYIENGSYWRMANLTLAYDAGYALKPFKGVNIFLTGQNLFILTKYTGFDPEVNANKSANSVPSLGIDVAQYPSARTVILGINFSL